MAESLYEALVGPYFSELSNSKKKKTTVAELGHSSLLPVYKSHIAKNANISRNTEQIIVRFNQNDLSKKSFQIYANGHSKIADEWIWASIV